MVSTSRVFLVLLLALSVSGPMKAGVPPSALSIRGGLQPVPPIIDIGRVPQGQAKTVTQLLTNPSPYTLTVGSIAVTEGPFKLLSVSGSSSVSPGGSFSVTVMSTGEEAGFNSGTLAISWGQGFGTAFVTLTASVESADPK